MASRLAFDHNGKRGPMVLSPSEIALAPERDLEALRTLVSGGTRLDIRDNWGETPIHLLAKRPDSLWVLIDTAGPLVMLKAINLRDKKGRTALYRAVECVEAAKILLRAGADPNIGDRYARTPLHIAEKPEVVEALLEAGADVSLEDLSGRVALHSMYNFETTKLLLAAGADPNARDSAGCTPLFYAKTVPTARQLLEGGCDPNAEDNSGRTASEFNRRKRVGRLLREHEGGARVTSPIQPALRRQKSDKIV